MAQNGDSTHMACYVCPLCWDAPIFSTQAEARLHELQFHRDDSQAPCANNLRSCGRGNDRYENFLNHLDALEGLAARYQVQVRLEVAHALLQAAMGDMRGLLEVGFCRPGDRPPLTINYRVEEPPTFDPQALAPPASAAMAQQVQLGSDSDSSAFMTLVDRAEAAGRHSAAQCWWTCLIRRLLQQRYRHVLLTFPCVADQLLRSPVLRRRRRRGGRRTHRLLRLNSAEHE